MSEEHLVPREIGFEPSTGSPGVLVVGAPLTGQRLPNAIPVSRFEGDECAFVEYPPTEKGDAFALRLVGDVPGIKTATLHGGGAFAATNLPLMFGIYLHRFRTQASIAPERCVTSATPPKTSAGRSVRIPHLVLVAEGAHATDSVVWELMPLQAVSGWLERPFSGSTEWVEDGLGQLLTIRRLIREKRLPPEGQLSELASLLGQRHLSIRFVLQHEDLLRAALAHDLAGCNEWRVAHPDRGGTD